MIVFFISYCLMSWSSTGSMTLLHVESLHKQALLFLNKEVYLLKFKCITCDFFVHNL